MITYILLAREICAHHLRKITRVYTHTNLSGFHAPITSSNSSDKAHVPDLNSSGRRKLKHCDENTAYHTCSTGHEQVAVQSYEMSGQTYETQSAVLLSMVWWCKTKGQTRRQNNGMMDENLVLVGSVRYTIYLEIRAPNKTSSLMTQSMPVLLYMSKAFLELTPIPDGKQEDSATRRSLNPQSHTPCRNQMQMARETNLLIILMPVFSI